MRILVTGSHGQVGRELVTQATALKYEVIGLERHRLDITEASAVRSIANEHHPDIVINAAAYTAVDKAEQEAERAFAVNKCGPANLASICSQRNIPLLHISTDYIFDGKQGRPYREDDSANPVGVYGQSKWEGEQAVREILSEHIILRVSWVFAAQGNNFVKIMLCLGRERNEISVVADQSGAPTCAADIANILLRLAGQALNKEERSSFSWGTYHYSGTPKTTWYGFAQEIFKQSHKLNLIPTIPKINAITTAEYPTVAARPANSVLDCSKIKKAFDIVQPDWQTGLQAVLKAER